jgi:uncharacterized protein YndB with AHSA1/START domain
MMQQNKKDIIHRIVTVPVAIDRAFAVFTERFASWYPNAYTWSGDVLDTIAIEPREGGRCFERGPHGFTCDWGRVLVWEPPQRLVFTWQIDYDRVPVPDPAKAGEVEVRFAADGPSITRVTFQHRGFARYGQSGDRYRAALDSPEGWSYILDRYVATVSS